MKLVIRHAALVLVVLALGAVVAVSAGGARDHNATSSRLAGPSYTPEELKALIAYSNASFAQKRKLLAG